MSYYDDKRNYNNHFRDLLFLNDFNKIIINDQEIYYTNNYPNKKKFIFNHGYAIGYYFGRIMMNKLIKYVLNKKYDVIIYHRLQHTKNEPLKMTIKRYENALLHIFNLMKSTNNECILFGHSLGAMYNRALNLYSNIKIKLLVSLDGSDLGTLVFFYKLEHPDFKLSNKKIKFHKTYFETNNKKYYYVQADDLTKLNIKDWLPKEFHKFYSFHTSNLTSERNNMNKFILEAGKITKKEIIVRYYATNKKLTESINENEHKLYGDNQLKLLRFVGNHSAHYKSQIANKIMHCVFSHII
jgi:hypothetical protein